MKRQIKLAIVGGRDFSDYPYLTSKIDELRQKYTVTEIVSGGAKGADSLGERYAKENHIPTKIFPAQWDVYGRSAGYKRNVLIVEECDMVAAFWDGCSKGTKLTIDIARAQGKTVLIFKF